MKLLTPHTVKKVFYLYNFGFFLFFFFSSLFKLQVMFCGQYTPVFQLQIASYDAVFSLSSCFGEIHSISFGFLCRLSWSFIEASYWADPYLVLLAFGVFSVAFVDLLRRLFLRFHHLQFHLGYANFYIIVPEIKIKVHLYLNLPLVVFKHRIFLMKIACIYSFKKRASKTREYGLIPQYWSLSFKSFLLKYSAQTQYICTYFLHRYEHIYCSFLCFSSKYQYLYIYLIVLNA